MASRQVHKLRLDKYVFMKEFLTREWLVTDSERNNVDTRDNASIDAVWDSFQHFLEVNGYSPDFCSKILLGKLLREAGVEKVKRGPRKQQKFYYYPLRPAAGSKAYEIVANSVEARHDASVSLRRRKKVMPEYFTIRSGSLGHVSVGVLHDRAISPEKYETKVLRRSLLRKAALSVKDKEGKQVDDYCNQASTSQNYSRRVINKVETFTHHYSADENDLRQQRNNSYHKGHDWSPSNYSREANLDESPPADDSMNLSALVAQSLSRLYDTEPGESCLSNANSGLTNGQEFYESSAQAEIIQLQKLFCVTEPERNEEIQNYDSSNTSPDVPIASLPHRPRMYSKKWQRGRKGPNAAQIISQEQFNEIIRQEVMIRKMQSRGRAFESDLPQRIGNRNRRLKVEAKPQRKHGQKPTYFDGKQNKRETKKHKTAKIKQVSNPQFLSTGESSVNINTPIKVEANWETPVAFKRPRGRPKGSKNKKKKTCEAGKAEEKAEEIYKKKPKQVKRPSKSGFKHTKGTIGVRSDLNVASSIHPIDVPEMNRNDNWDDDELRPMHTACGRSLAKSLIDLERFYETEGYSCYGPSYTYNSIDQPPLQQNEDSLVDSLYESPMPPQSTYVPSVSSEAGGYLEQPRDFVEMRCMNPHAWKVAADSE
ncbi:uncharacterized protein LOC108675130 [Hyalella azteca]|uniref:Uncharacterized protein LOC108675130 n=1 Tax=Hyalella azteca TaxID=294128 RepID=A0A8B7NXY7_HYAAZ|nr:uncharacterized protein LOC108675130 [Hyalella azteca]XP_018018607.1 uncharacterized protein LOC108675130 [Hyalella azteca]